MRRLWAIAGLAAAAVMCASLLGIGLVLMGDGVEVSASFAYSLEPTEATKGARDEAFAMAKRRRWRGVLFFGCGFAVSGAVLALVIKRTTRNCI